jgi:predicted transcriptional regulator
MITKHHKAEYGVAGTLYDRETGEILGDYGLRPPKRCTLTDWLMVFHKSMEVMAKDKDLTSEIWRVFAYAISQLDYDNKLLLTQADIARGLEIKQPNVNRAFKLLVNKGIFIEGEKRGTSKTYYLAGAIGNKGKARNYQNKLKRELNLQKVDLPQKDSKTLSSPDLKDLIETHCSVA